MSDREGVDVASFQGAPGQWRGPAGDIGWAAVKLTELGADGSRYVNPDAAADWQYLASAGKKRIAYLFGHPGASAAETASFFVGEARSLGLRDDDMVAVDLEVNDGKTPAEVSAWARDVLNFLEHDLDRLPLCYTFLNFAQTGNCEGLGGWPLWMSDPDSPPGQPRVPAPWKGWAIHQFATTGAIDRDICAYKSAAVMADLLGRRTHILHRPEPGPGKAVHVPKHRVRKAGKKAVAVTKGGVKKEPVMTSAGTTALATVLLGFLQHYHVLHLDPAQVKYIVTCLVAFFGIIAAAVTTPSRVGGMTTVIGTAATALTGTLGGPMLMTIVVPLLSLFAGHHVRNQVSPKAPPAEPPAA